MDVNIQVIARMHSDFATKFGIPRQSGLVEELRSTIVFEPEFRNTDALRGIEDFSHLWIIWQFSEAVRQGWSPTVRPPRLGDGYYERPRRPRAPVHTDRLTVGQPVPAATAEARQSMNSLNPGDRVTHASFGDGEILSIKPMGADKLIEVMFDTAGTKKLMGTYAKLKKLEE